MKKTLFFSALATVLLISSCASENATDDTSDSEDSTEQNDDETSNEDSEEMSRKKELLTSLVGDYNLTYVDGLIGANTMIEYTLHDAVWSASGSSIVEGMREGYDIDLSKEDQKQINSMQISVSEDLTVTFSSGGKTYFSVPFSEDGMSFSLANPVEDYSSVITEGLTASTTFINDDLYLYAKDGFGEDELAGADLLEIGADAMMLTYNSDSKEFELSIFYADCCDTGVYTFK